MKSIIYEKPISSSLTIASEPEVLYVTSSKLREFTISKFEALGKKLLFSQSEWADILHISDRTLQRYIKDNKPFEGLHAEHLQQLDNMANLALEIFSKPEKVKSWLMLSKQVLQHSLNFASLQSFWGVKLISNELGRIAYGVYI
jgi:putative toxin-antitoxin system antitoxin component (TIGR02293 family)